LSALKEYEKFWIDDVPAALKRPYNILGHNSLWDICKATFDEVAADDLGGLTGSHLDLKKRA
jgi:hypothetical protein